MTRILNRVRTLARDMADRPNPSEPNRRCNRCGEAVSRSFVRVFGLGNSVDGCINCLSRKRLSNGEAATRPQSEHPETESRATWAGTTE